MSRQPSAQSIAVVFLLFLWAPYAAAKDDPVSTWAKRASVPELASEATGALLCPDTGGKCDTSSLEGLGGNVAQEVVKTRVGQELNTVATRAAQREAVREAHERAARETGKRVFDRSVAGGASKQAAAEAAERAAQEGAEQAGREATEKLVRDAGNEAAENAAKIAARQGLDSATIERAASQAREAAEKGARDAVGEVVEHGPGQAAGRATREASGEIVESAATRGGTRLGRGVLSEFVEAGKGKGVTGGSALDHLGTGAGMAGAFSGDDPVGVAQEGLHGLATTTFVAAGTGIGTAEGGKWGTIVGCWVAPGPGCVVGGTVGAIGGGLLGAAVGAVAGANAKSAAEPHWETLSGKRRDAIDFNRRAEAARRRFRTAALECNAANRSLDLAKARIDKAVSVATRINGKRGDASMAVSTAESDVTACADVRSAGEELVNLLSVLNERIDMMRSLQSATTNLTNGICKKSAAARSGGVPGNELSKAAADARAELANADSNRSQAEDALARARKVAGRLEAMHGRVGKLLEGARKARESLDTTAGALQKLAEQAVEAGTALGDADAKLGQARADFESCRANEDNARKLLAAYMGKEGLLDKNSTELVRLESSMINMRYDRVNEIAPQLQEARGYLDTEQSALPALQARVQSAVPGLTACLNVDPRTAEVNSALNLFKTYEANLVRDLTQAVAGAQGCVDTLVAMANSPPSPADGGADGSSGSAGKGSGGCDPTNPAGGCYNPLADPNTVAGGDSGSGVGSGGVDPGTIPGLDEPRVPGSGNTENAPTPGQPIDPGYTADPIQDVQDTERVIDAEKSPGGPFTPRAPEQPGSDIADDFGTPPDIADIPDRETGRDTGSSDSGSTDNSGTDNTSNTSGKTDNDGGGGTESSDSSDTGPVTQTASCNDTNEAGSNKPERYTIDVGSGQGDITLSWTMYTIKDQMSVSGAGVSFSTGCVSGSDSVTLKKSGTAAKITVDISPNCDSGQKGRNTRWNFSLSCPKSRSPRPTQNTGTGKSKNPCGEISNSDSSARKTAWIECTRNLARQRKE